MNAFSRFASIGVLSFEGFTLDLQACWQLTSSYDRAVSAQVPLLPCECCVEMQDPWCKLLGDTSFCFDAEFTAESCCKPFQQRSWSLKAHVTHRSNISLEIVFRPEDTPWWMHFWTRDFPHYGLAEIAASQLFHRPDR